MELEIQPILLAAYPELDTEQLDIMKDMFLDRCVASVTDTVNRVARDPFRKLQKGARIRGSLELAAKLQREKRLEIPTPRLTFGCAAGFVWAIHRLNNSDADSKLAASLYNRDKSFKSVLCYNGPGGGSFFEGFSEEEDAALLRACLQDCQELNNWLQSTHIGWPDPEEQDLARTRANLASLGVQVDDAGHLRYAPDFKPTAMDFQLVIVRHGETYGNCGLGTANGEIDYERVRLNEKSSERRIFQGNTDFSLNRLNSVGNKQASRVAEILNARYVSTGWFPDVGITFLSSSVLLPV